MEGPDGRPIPEEQRPNGLMTRTFAVVIVIVVVLAAVLGAALFLGLGEDNKSPVAHLTASSDFVSLGSSVFLNGSSSSDPDGSIRSYSWNFGNGMVLNTTTAIVSYVYPFPGMYIIILSVEDDKGARASSWNDLLRVEVTNAPNPDEPTNDSSPFALAAASEDIISSGDEVSFDAASSQGWSVEDDGYGGLAPIRDSAFIAQLCWKFGDGPDEFAGSYEEAKAVNHTYTGTERLFSAFVTVTSLHGAEQRYYLTIASPATDNTGLTTDPNIIVKLDTVEPYSLDPAYNYEAAGGEVLQNVYETLIWYDGASTTHLVPLLATNVPTIENGDVTPDGLDYTFHLKQGVQFHHTDGEEWGAMTAEDVEYSLERVLSMNDPWSPAWMLGQLMIPDYYDYSVPPSDMINDTVEILDDYTVVIHLMVAYPAFIYILAFTACSVVCKDFVEAHGGVVRGEAYNAYMNNHCCGTGPYQFKEWVYSQYWLLERFEGYHKGPAPVRNVLYRVVGDVSTREMIFFSGQADLCNIPRQHMADLNGREDMIRVMKGLPNFDINFIGFNQNIYYSSTLDQGNITPWFFQDVNVRKAFASCFDSQTYINDVMMGTGILPNGVVPKGMFGYNPDVPTYEYNLTLAAQYLKMAINNDTGKSWADQGFRIVLYHDANNPSSEATSMLMANGLRQLSLQGLVNGTIIADYQALDWAGAYLPAIENSWLPMFIIGWYPDYADPDDYAQPFYHEYGTFASRFGLQDATLTSMVEAASIEQNRSAREAIYKDMAWYVYNESYYLWLLQSTNFHVEMKWMSGWYHNPMYGGEYYYVLSKNVGN